MNNTCYLEISRKALKKNVRMLKKYFGKNVRISSVIKGNAYGHDITKMLPLLEEFGINHFAVFSSVEARLAKESSNGKSQLMIMGYIADEDWQWVIQNDVEFFVFDFEGLMSAFQIAKLLKKTAKIHLELETGLNRTGFNKKDLGKAVTFIKKNIDYFEIEGICTHLAGAESINNYLRIKEQIKNFKALYRYVKKRGLNPKLRHMACSAAAISYPESRMDMVRIGIMQYGLWPSKETYIQYSMRNNKKNNALQRVISWKTNVLSLKNIDKGEYVGYGTNFIAPYDMKLAVVPVGYSQGYTRALSYQGKVLVRRRRADIFGMINMNMLLVDVTRIPQIRKGDEVVLIGKQGRFEITIASFNEASEQLNNELLTRLPMDIPRVIVD